MEAIEEIKNGDSEIANELSARDAFRKAKMLENLLNLQLQKRRSIWKDRRMSALDTAAVQAYRKALEGAIKDGGKDTVYGKRANQSLKSLNMEYETN